MHFSLPPAKGGQTLGGELGSRKSSDGGANDAGWRTSAEPKLENVSIADAEGPGNSSNNNNTNNNAAGDRSAALAACELTRAPAPPPAQQPKSILKRSPSGQVQAGGSRDDPPDDRLAGGGGQADGQSRRLLVRFSDTPSSPEQAQVQAASLPAGIH